MWWNEEQAVASGFTIRDATGVTTFSIERVAKAVPITRSLDDVDAYLAGTLAGAAEGRA